MATTFATEPLPRARTGDGVFFDMPIIGLVVYSQKLELPLALLALVLVGAVVIRVRRGVVTGVLASVLAVALSGGIGWAIGRRLDGPAMWSGLYAAGLVLLAMSATAACRALAMRWSSPRGLHTGALVVWLVLALVLSIRVPGAGYLFTWPLLFAAAAALLVRGRTVAEWVAAAVTLLILAGFSYGVSVVMLGLLGGGAIILCVIASLVTLLLAPKLEEVAGGARWWSAASLALAAGVCLAIAALTIRPGAHHPARTALVYTENADSSDAWLGTLGSTSDAWTRGVIGEGTTVRGPAWTANLLGYPGSFTGRQVQRAALASPDATLIGDSLVNGARRVVLRISAPAGTTGLVMRAHGGPVLTSSIDGRVVDTTRYRTGERYRDRTGDWVMQYWAVPDSGAIVALSIPAEGHIVLDLSARRPGIPPIPGVAIPARPSDVVPSQTGDVSIVYRERRF
ncbi:MAG TPA: hypothetical protein VN717_08410, partial [Gemmatimonadaceae bacterium]|nr:hypothetical protein [Gemmatimonadaceae bacterium]